MSEEILKRSAFLLVLLALAACPHPRRAVPTPVTEGQSTFLFLQNEPSPEAQLKPDEEIVPPRASGPLALPFYPPAALAARLGHAVIVLRLVIGTDGRIASAEKSPRDLLLRGLREGVPRGHPGSRPKLGFPAGGMAAAGERKGLQWGRENRLSAGCRKPDDGGVLRCPVRFRHQGWSRSGPRPLAAGWNIAVQKGGTTTVHTGEWDVGEMRRCCNGQRLCSASPGAPSADSGSISGTTGIAAACRGDVGHRLRIGSVDSPAHRTGYLLRWLLRIGAWPVVTYRSPDK